jgi:hypothetical protein
MTRITDLHQWLSLRQESESLLKDRFEDSLQGCVGCIPARDPQNLRWRPTAFQEIDEISIFRHHNYTSVPRRIEHRLVFSLVKIQLTEMLDFDVVPGPKPPDQVARKVLIDPELHAATIG